MCSCVLEKTGEHIQRDRASKSLVSRAAFFFFFFVHFKRRKNTKKKKKKKKEENQQKQKLPYVSTFFFYFIFFFLLSDPFPTPNHVSPPPRLHKMTCHIAHPTHHSTGVSTSTNTTQPNAAQHNKYNIQHTTVDRLEETLFLGPQKKT